MGSERVKKYLNDPMKRSFTAEIYQWSFVKINTVEKFDDYPTLKKNYLLSTVYHLYVVVTIYYSSSITFYIFVFHYLPFSIYYLLCIMYFLY